MGVQTLSTLIYYQHQVNYRRSRLQDPSVSWKVRHKSDASFPLGAVHADQTPIHFKQALTFKRRIKSHLPFAGIIRSAPYSPRFQDNG